MPIEGYSFPGGEGKLQCEDDAGGEETCESQVEAHVGPSEAEDGCLFS